MTDPHRVLLHHANSNLFRDTVPLEEPSANDRSVIGSEQQALFTPSSASNELSGNFTDSTRYASVRTEDQPFPGYPTNNFGTEDLVSSRDCDGSFYGSPSGQVMGTPMPVTWNENPPSHHEQSFTHYGDPIGVPNSQGNSLYGVENTFYYSHFDGQARQGSMDYHPANTNVPVCQPDHLYHLPIQETPEDAEGFHASE